MSKEIILTETDQTKGSPHPRFTKGLIGQAYAKELFIKSFNSKKMHHAWIFSGRKGIGKATLAWQITKALMQKPEKINNLDVFQTSEEVKKVESLASPGVFLCRRQYDPKEKKIQSEISVQEVRKMIKFFSLTNMNSDWRVAIIDNLNEMNKSASNALLKILEEPPKKSLFILICNQINTIVPTIKSRCQILRFEQLNKVDFSNILQQAIKIKETNINIDELYLLSEGSPGNGIEFISAETLTLYKKSIQAINFDTKINRVKVWEIADTAAVEYKNNRNFDVTAETILKMVSRLSKNVFRKVEPIDSNETAIIERLKKNKESSFELAILYEELSTQFKNAKFSNLDPKQTIVLVFAIIERTLLRLKSQKLVNK